MSSGRPYYRKRSKSADVNPEVIRKARKLLEVYNQIPVPNMRTGTMSIDLQMMVRNGCFTINDKLKNFVYRCIANHERNFDPNNVVCTFITGTTGNRGKLVYQTKEPGRFQWITVSSCKLSKNVNIIWNCPFSRQVYENDYINPKKVFDDIPERRKYNNDNIVPLDMDKEIIYPVFINNSSGDLVTVLKKSGYCVPVY